MKTKNIIPLTLAICLAGCADNTFDKDPTHENDGKLEFYIRGEIEQVNETRANDNGFADGDKIGIYAVSFENGNPGTLLDEGNLATNVRFVFDEEHDSWDGDRQLYFDDDKTPADIIGYYPYVDKIPTVHSMPFTVERNQGEEGKAGQLSAYEKSDLLYGKTSGIAPTTKIITVNFVHALAGIKVSLVEGIGFEVGEWDGIEKSVMVDNTIRSARLDLSSGTISPDGDYDGQAIIAKRHGNDFRAVTVPQTMEEGKTLLSITVGSQNYAFSKKERITYLPSRLHKFTIQVNKILPEGDYEFSLINEAITVWENDPESHNGEAKEYTIIDVPAFGLLEQTIKEAGLTPSAIKNLKLSGKLNAIDFWWLRDNAIRLEALNLMDAEVENLEIPNTALTNSLCLKHIVLPSKLTTIGKFAFGGCPLVGSLEIPEGVTHIMESAFDNGWPKGFAVSEIPGEGRLIGKSSMTGTLSLPPTLKTIDNNAFRKCDFTGELSLPDTMESIGENAFSDCTHLTGELHLPTSLTTLGTNAFSNTPGLRGDIVIPKGITDIPAAFGGSGLSGIILHEDVLRLNENALGNLPLRGDLTIPKSVTRIDRAAFQNTNLSHIILPTHLEFIEDYIMADCKMLIDTITIPSGIESIGEGAFKNCPKLEAIILPATTLLIKPSAFENCFSLNYIRCDAKEPPAVDESAFYGINKNNFTVEVPDESVDLYRNAEGWREFKRIAAYRNFIARPSKYNVLNAGGKREIVLNADAEWETVSLPSWCHLDKDSGNKKTTLTLTIDAMPHGEGNREGKIEFRLKDSEQHLTHVNIGQYDYDYEEDSYITLQRATRGDGIDIFIVGDGYDALDISSGTLLADMRQEIEYFFGIEPYTTYRDYFNVYTAIALSDESGVEDINHWRKTKFHTIVTNSDTRFSTDWMSAMDYCAKVCPPIANRPNPKVGVILLANTDIYEGITYIGDSFCAVVTKSSLDYPNDARGIVQHEAGGHGFGWLADEYIYHSGYIQKCKCLCCQHVDELRAGHAWNYGLNISLEGKYQKVPWSHLIYHPSYTDIVDIYEGGYFHSRGIFRSEYNSCMNNNVPYFSTWSRQLIVQRIMSLAGEEFSLENFYANDKRDMGLDFTSTSRSTRQSNAPVPKHRHAPIHIMDYTFAKKGGKR